jgi:hypothetical protein
MARFGAAWFGMAWLGMDRERFDLVLPFDRDDPEFARGVEIGMLYQRLRSDQLPIIAIVHEANVEMILRLAETMNAPVQAEDVGGEWLAVTFR